MQIRTCFHLAGLTLGSIAACGGISGEVSPVQEMSGAGGGAPDARTGAGSAGVAAVRPTGTAGSGSTGVGGAATIDTADRVPQAHRAARAMCDRERPASNYRPYAEDALPCPQDGGVCPVPEDCPGCRAACIDVDAGRRCAVAYPDSACLADSECSAGDQGRCWANRGSTFCTYDTCYSDATCTSGGPCACEGESGSPGNTCLPGNCQIDADCGARGYCSPTFGGCGNYSGVIGHYCHTPADTCVDDADCVDPANGAGYCMYSPEVGHWSCGYSQCVG